MEYTRATTSISSDVIASSLSSSGVADKLAYIEQYLTAASNNKNFMGTILIHSHGKDYFSKGYGYAVVEHDILHKPSSVFRIGSITKQFTALCILQLQEKKLLSVHDTIDKHLAELPFGSVVTIHHLLTQTSGIYSYTFDFRKEENKQIWRRTPQEAEMLGMFKDKPLQFTPGTEMAYSNSNYYLLGLIIRSVSGLSYEEYLKAHVFAPLGMQNSGIDRADLLLKHRAFGYVNPADGSPLKPGEPEDICASAGAAGAMYSTTEDLLKWLKGLRRYALISKESTREMFGKHIVTEEDATDEEEEPNGVTHFYGYGVYVSVDSSTGQIQTVGHSGATFGGFKSYVKIIYGSSPEDDIYLIVLGNENRISGKVGVDLCSYFTTHQKPALLV